MGAQLSHRAAPWFADPDEALLALQAEWLAENVPVFADGIAEEPFGWYFVGHTVD